MELSDEQKNVIDAELGPISVTACAGSGKTATAIRRLIAVRQKMGISRGRVVLLSFSNVAVDTFNKGYQRLASTLPDDANRKLVEVDTLDGFFTQHVLRPHAYRTMAAAKVAYLVAGSEPFLSNYQYWPGGKARPTPVKEFKVGMEDGNPFFFVDTHKEPERLVTWKALDSVKRLGGIGAYTHELGRYWVYRTLIEQPAVLRALTARYPQILVDESQDLGTLHQSILELLINAGATISLIGDVNQGIFAFAGADGMFLKNYKDRNGTTPFELTRNYRSLPPIIDIANRLCNRDDEPEREPGPGGAYFVGYKESELTMLFDSFKARIGELGMPHDDAVVLCRGADRAGTLAGKIAPPGQGTVAMFSEAALLRDQQGRYQDCFKFVCRAVVGLLDGAPHGLSSELQGAPHEGWMLRLRRLLWRFIRDEKSGLPPSTLSAATEWHPKLLTNVKSLLAVIEKQFGLKPVTKLGNKLAKTKLSDHPLAGAAAPEKKGPGLRVETVHQVKGESIGAVLYVTKKPNVEALLAGTDSEEGRIGYVAVTRAKDLFWLAVPSTCLKDLREELIAAGFEELPALK